MSLQLHSLLLFFRRPLDWILLNCGFRKSITAEGIHFSGRPLQRLCTGACCSFLLGTVSALLTEKSANAVRRTKWRSFSLVSRSYISSMPSAYCIRALRRVIHRMPRVMLWQTGILCSVCLQRSVDAEVTLTNKHVGCGSVP